MNKILFFLIVPSFIAAMTISAIIPVGRANACGTGLEVTAQPNYLGAVPIGSSKTINVVIEPSCTGDGDQTVTSITITGTNSDQFSRSTDCDGVTIDDYDTCTFTVTFTPTSTGTKNAGVLVVTDEESSTGGFWGDAVEAIDDNTALLALLINGDNGDGGECGSEGNAASYKSKKNGFLPPLLGLMAMMMVPLAGISIFRKIKRRAVK